MNNPWESEEGKVVWKTEAQYWNWLRGALRKLWSDYPLRKVWKKNSLRPLTLEEKQSGKFHPSTKNVGECVFCKTVMAGSKLECDHVIESEGCTSKETAESFLWHCGGQTSVNFQLVCKPCHKIKSYSEAKGISFEEAVIEKKAIEICKGDEKSWITSKGFTPESNAKLRRKQVVEILTQENNND